MLDLVAECVEWICSYLAGEERAATSEEEVDRLALRFLLRKRAETAKITDLITDSSKLSEFSKMVRDALFSEPVTISCFLPERVEASGCTLFCPHGFKPDVPEKVKAIEEVLKARRISDALDAAHSVFSRFFGVKPDREGIFLVIRRNGGYRLFISSIDELDEDITFHFKLARDFEENYVVVVLTDKTPLPFIKFFRKNSENVRREKILIWVMDEDREYVDPFIGYPPDEELISRFRNPKLATQIESLWRSKVNRF